MDLIQDLMQNNQHGCRVQLLHGGILHPMACQHLEVEEVICASQVSANSIQETRNGTYVYFPIILEDAICNPTFRHVVCTYCTAFISSALPRFLLILFCTVPAANCTFEYMGRASSTPCFPFYR